MEDGQRVNSIPSTAFKNSFNQVIPITNCRGELTLMIYLDERKAKRSLVITNEALAANLGMNKIILEELHASEELTTNELSECFYSQSILDTEKLFQNRISPLEVVGEVVPRNKMLLLSMCFRKPFTKFENPSFKGEDHKTKRTKKHIVNDNLQLKPQSKNFGTYISSEMSWVKNLQTSLYAILC